MSKVCNTVQHILMMFHLLFKTRYDHVFSISNMALCTPLRIRTECLLTGHLSPSISLSISMPCVCEVIYIHPLASWQDLELKATLFHIAHCKQSQPLCQCHLQPLLPQFIDSSTDPVKTQASVCCCHPVSTLSKSSPG